MLIRRWSRCKSVFVVGILILAVFMAGGCTILPNNEEPLRPPLVKPVEIVNTVVEAKIGTIVKNVTGTAVLESDQQDYYQFEETGARVRTIHVKAGDRIKEGQLLISLDQSGLDTELLQRQIDVEKREQALEDAKVDANKRTVKIAFLELALAKKMLADTQQKYEARELRSNMEGVVTFVAEIKPGDYVEPYRTLVVAANENQMRLAFNVISPEQVSDVAVGMKAKLQFKTQTLQGEVVQTPSSAPSTTDEELRKKNAKTLYIQMDKTPADSKFGDLVNVEIEIAKRENVVTIPKSGLKSSFGRNYVQIQEGQSRREVDVVVGLETSTEVEIVKGLKAGNQVIVH